MSSSTRVCTLLSVSPLVSFVVDMFSYELASTKHLILQNSSVTSVTLRGLHEWTHGQDVLTAQRAQHASGAA